MMDGPVLPEASSKRDQRFFGGLGASTLAGQFFELSVSSSLNFTSTLWTKADGIRSQVNVLFAMRTTIEPRLNKKYDANYRNQMP